MTLIYVVTSLGIIAGMALALYRGLDGPTLYDRILAVNSFGTNTVLMIALLGFLMGRPDFLDIAMVYALINFIGTIAVLKFFEYQDLGKQSSIYHKGASKNGDFRARAMAEQGSGAHKQK